MYNISEKPNYLNESDEIVEEIYGNQNLNFTQSFNPNKNHQSIYNNSQIDDIKESIINNKSTNQNYQIINNNSQIQDIKESIINQKPNNGHQTYNTFNNTSEKEDIKVSNMNQNQINQSINQNYNSFNNNSQKEEIKESHINQKTKNNMKKNNQSIKKNSQNLNKTNKSKIYNSQFHTFNKEKLTNEKINELVEKYERELLNEFLELCKKEDKENKERDKLLSKVTNEKEKKRLTKILAMERAQSSDKIGKFNQLIYDKVAEYKNNLLEKMSKQ